MRYMLLALVCILLSVFTGLGQDPLKRMDPDTWLSLAEVGAMLNWASDQDGAYSMQLWSPSGELSKPHGTESNWLIRDGDLRVVLDSQHVNLSRSHNLGFNLGSKSMVHNGRLLSLGGRGFWDGHAKLIEFVEKSGEWEWVMTEGEGPECAIRVSTWFEPLTGQVFSIDEGDWGKANDAGPNEVWRLDVDAQSWEHVGRVSPIMDLFVLGKGKLIDLEDYFVWPGIHKSAIVRKSDRQTVFTTLWNWSDLQEAIDRAKEQAMRMTVAAGNRYRVLSLNDEGEEAQWLEWDVAAAFEAAAKLGDAVPWIVPLNQSPQTAKEPLAQDAQANMPIALWAAVVLIVAGVSFGVGRRGGQSGAMPSTSNEGKHIVEVTSTVDEGPSKAEKNSAAQAILALISELEAAGGRIMSTEELNDFLELSHDVSSESKRAKRAQFIRDVNRVYQMRHGKEMIVREKDLNDRRRTIYVIHPCSGTA